MSDMIALLLPFVLVLTRLSAFMIILPVFGWPSLPVRIKVSIVFITSLFICGVTSIGPIPSQVKDFQAIITLINEAIFGAALGITISILFQAVKVAAGIIEQQIGLTSAEIFDPFTGDSGQPLGSLLEIIFLLMFLAANGHHAFLRIIHRSYKILPAGSPIDIAGITEAVIRSGAEMFTAALQISGPILAAFLVILCLFAVFARIVPEMNILFISMPVRVGVGMILVTLFLPFLETFVSKFAEIIVELLPI